MPLQLTRLLASSSLDTFFENAFHFGPSFPSSDIQRSFAPLVESPPLLLLSCLAFASQFSANPLIYAQRGVLYARARQALESPSPATPPHEFALAGTVLARAAVLNGAPSDARHFIGGRRPLRFTETFETNASLFPGT